MKPRVISVAPFSSLEREAHDSRGPPHHSPRERGGVSGPLPMLTPSPTAD